MPILSKKILNIWKKFFIIDLHGQTKRPCLETNTLKKRRVYQSKKLRKNKPKKHLVSSFYSLLSAVPKLPDTWAGEAFLIF